MLAVNASFLRMTFPQSVEPPTEWIRSSIPYVSANHHALRVRLRRFFVFFNVNSLSLYTHLITN